MKPRQIQVPSDPPQPDHSLRNAAIVGGAVLVAGGGLALQGKRILDVQKKTLQRAAKRDRATAFRDKLKGAAAIARERVKPTTTPVDPHRSQLTAKIHQNRFMVDFPRPQNPDYEKHVDAIMQRVHADIPEADKLLQTHTPKEAAVEINKIKSGRINSEVATLKTKYQDRRDEGKAWNDFHKGQLAAHFASLGEPNILNKEKLPEQFRDYGYSKQHKAIVNLKNPPELEPKKRGLERLIKLIELDVTLKEGRDNSGKFTSGGGAMLPDPGSLQYAYHMPMVNPNGQSMPGQGRRGRGRPPGSLNRRTLAEAQMVQADAQSQQPESRPSSNVGRNVAIGAGLLAGGALVAGPRIARAFTEHTATSRAVKKVLPKLVAGEHLDFAESAMKQGHSVEEAITKAHEASLVSEKPVEDVVAAADLFAKENPGVAFADNPHINPERAARMAKETKGMVNTKATIDAAKAREETAKAHTKISSKELDIQRLEQQLKQSQKDHAEIIEKHGQTSQQSKEQQALIGDLQTRLQNSAEPLTSQEKVRAALATLKQEGGEGTSDQEVAALRKHHRTFGRNVPTIQVRPDKQGDLFDVLNVARTGQLGTSTIPYDTAAERVEFLKSKNLANRGPEIERIAKQHGHESEDVAHAMALRQIAGETAHIEPAIRPPRPGATSGELAKHEATVRSRDEEVLASDRLTKTHGELFIRTKGREASTAYTEEMRQTGAKADPKERARRIAEAEESAARAYARQSVSTGRIKKSALRGVAIGKSATAGELAFARRLQNRIELMRNPLPREPLRPGMIELGSMLPKTQAGIDKFYAPFTKKVKLKSSGVGLIDAIKAYRAMAK